MYLAIVQCSAAVVVLLCLMMYCLVLCRTEEHRLREAAQYGDWMKKEEDYHIEQTKVRDACDAILLALQLLLLECECGDIRC